MQIRTVDDVYASMVEQYSGGTGGNIFRFQDGEYDPSGNEVASRIEETFELFRQFLIGSEVSLDDVNIRQQSNFTGHDLSVRVFRVKIGEPIFIDGGITVSNKQGLLKDAQTFGSRQLVGRLGARSYMTNMNPRNFLERIREGNPDEIGIYGYFDAVSDDLPREHTGLISEEVHEKFIGGERYFQAIKRIHGVGFNAGDGQSRVKFRPRLLETKSVAPQAGFKEFENWVSANIVRELLDQASV